MANYPQNTQRTQKKIDPKAGACGSVLSVLNHPQLNHQMQVGQGILAEQCGDLLRVFFRDRRVRSESAL